MDDLVIVPSAWCGDATEKVCCLDQGCLAVNLNLSPTAQHNAPAVITCHLLAVELFKVEFQPCRASLENRCRKAERRKMLGQDV